MSILFKACLFNLTFYKGSHSKGLKQRAMHVHQRKTKHFIAKLFAQPFMVLQTFLKIMFATCFETCFENDFKLVMKLVLKLALKPVLNLILKLVLKLALNVLMVRVVEVTDWGGMDGFRKKANCLEKNWNVTHLLTNAAG